MASLFSALTGKRTYLIALLAIAYLIYCQATHQKPDETILGLFGALGLATLRAGIKGAVVQALNDEIDPPHAAPQVVPLAPAPGQSRDGGGKVIGIVPFVALFGFGLFMLFTAGCASGPGSIVTAKVELAYGTNRVAFTQPKDTTIESLTLTRDGTVNLRGYRSTANESAIKASEQQAAMFQAMMAQAFQIGQAAARLYGIPMPSPAPTQPVADSFTPPAANDLVIKPNPQWKGAPLGQGGSITFTPSVISTPAIGGINGEIRTLEAASALTITNAP